MMRLHTLAVCRANDPVLYGSLKRSQRARTCGASSAYRLLGRSGNRWCSIWWLRFPLMRWKSGLPVMFAEPSSCRKYHAPRVSPSRYSSVKTSAPAGSDHRR